jgi:serine/threonine-protein kinase
MRTSKTAMADTTPPTSLRPPPDDPLEQIQRLWDEGRPPDLGAFVARAGPLQPDQLAAVLRVDQRGRWRAGERVPAEVYLQRFAAVAGNAEAVLDLVFNEFLLREERGDGPDVEDYLRRFPAVASDFRAQVELHQALATHTGPAANSPGPATVPAAAAPPAPSVTWTALPYRFGRYRVEQLLGRGGMGEVYRAHDTQLNRPVALKLPRLGDDPERLARFGREARIAAACTDAGLCPVYDVGVIDGIHFFTMPLFDGETLADRLDRQGPLPADEAIRLVARAARALETAHAAGVVHRDLKPSNIMLTRRGEPIVLDFGLARQATGERLTLSGQFMGTPSYMAPEQLGGRPQDLGAASDVYGLGAVLYAALTGGPPFPGPAQEALLRCLTEAPPPPSRLRPGLDRRLDALCLTALARQPARRFASMAVFAEALESCLQLAGPPVPDRRPSRRPSRRVVLLIAVGLALVAAVGLAGHAWYTAPPDDPFPAGSRWEGTFQFRPPIQNFRGEVAIDVDSRDGDEFKGLYTSEGGAYCWRIAGTATGAMVRWQFIDVVHEKKPTTVVGQARGEGQLERHELKGLYIDSNSSAELRLRRTK